MERQEAEQALADCKARIISGEQSFLELIRIPADGDYRSHVDAMRFAAVLMSDVGVLKAITKEIDAETTRHHVAGVDPNQIDKEIRLKDGIRRFEKLGAYHEMSDDLSPLLDGNFEDRLEKYIELISFVEKRWADACTKYSAGDFPIACFTAILVLEEVGKLSRLWAELSDYQATPKATKKPIADKDHRRKHFLAVVAGAVVNARLDRVLGKDVVRKILHNAESDELEKLRQSCLYIDFDGDEARPPTARISAEVAQTYVVLAGEIMAEVLGHFPWEWRRMIGAVIDFERSVGMPEKKIKLN